MTRLAVTLAAVLSLLPALRAQEASDPALWAVPGDPVAYWAVDPSFLGEAAGTDPNRAVLEWVLVRLIHGTAPDAAALPVLQALLRPGLAGPTPYRFTLLDVRLVDGEVRGSAALRFFAGERRAVFEAALREAIEVTEPRVNIEREKIEGAAVFRAGAIAWAAEEDTLTVVFGDAPIGEALRNAPAGDPASTAYRARCASVHPSGTPVFEAFVDLDRLRRAAPELMGWGRVADLLRAWRISNARGLMLRAGATPGEGDGARTVHVALAWAARAEPPVRVRGASVTHAAWPASLGPAPGDAAYTMVLAIPPQLAISLALFSYEALAEDAAFVGRKQAWLRNIGVRLERTLRPMPPAIGLAGPGDSIASPSLHIAATHTAESREDVRAVLSSLGPAVARDERAAFWSIDTRPVGRAGRFLLSASEHGFTGAWRAEQLPRPPATPGR
jgi:hypothetical protein